MSDTETSEEDDGGIFCQSCTPTTRKCGYYITFIVGFIGFAYGLVDIFLGNTQTIAIIASVIILFCPLWIKSPKKCCFEFKNILRVTSALIFFAFLVLNIVACFIEFSSFLNYLFGVLLGVSGVWYFLSFCPNGQKACIDCIKNCCGGSAETA